MCKFGKYVTEVSDLKKKPISNRLAEILFREFKVNKKENPLHSFFHWKCQIIILRRAVSRDFFFVHQTLPSSVVEPKPVKMHRIRTVTNKLRFVGINYYFLNLHMLRPYLHTLKEKSVPVHF